MDLDEFAVGVVDALLKQRGVGRAGADHGVGGFAEDGPVASGGEDDGVGREGFELHGAQVEGGDAARDAFGVDDGGEKLPAFVFVDVAGRLVAAHLLVERVEKLLAGGCAGESGAVVKCAAETAEVEQALRGAVEGHAHAIEQIDDGGRGLAHQFDRGLVGEEITAVDGVVEVLVGGVALALEVFGGVDAALCADRVGTLDGDDGKEIDIAAGFGDFDDRSEACESSANHYDFG